jgi:hypothetical protein
MFGQVKKEPIEGVFYPSPKEMRDYQQSPNWRRFKRKYLADPSTPKACVVCGNTNFVLHHWTYERWGGQERLDDVVPMCPVHHRRLHLAVDAGTYKLATAHLEMPREWNSGYRFTTPGTQRIHKGFSRTIHKFNQVQVTVDKEEARRRIEEAKKKSRLKP